MDLRITDNLAIPAAELRFKFSRSGGPGGQNVNKVNSKATLQWDVIQSPALPDDVKQRFLARYGNRVTKEGTFILSSQQYREQPRNVADCLERLAEFVRGVLRPRKPRRPTKPTRGSRERRMRAKRHQSDKKNLRGPGQHDG